MRFLLQITIIWSSAIMHVISQDPFIIKLEVIGPNFSKSGVARFTVLENATEIKLRCSIYDFVRTNISILKERKVENSFHSNGTGSYISFNVTTNPIAGNYSCRISVSIAAGNSSYFSYIMESKVNVNFGKNLSCLSSIGDSGIFGEKGSLSCRGDNLMWKTNNRSYITRQITITTGFRTSESCVLKEHQTSGLIEVCKSPNLTVLPSIQVDITPAVFTANRILYFQCTSKPHRLLYWSVFGTHGNLLGYDNLKLNNVTMVNTSVSIEQAAGWTSLNISEAVAGGNGIHLVICSTYDTQVRHATALLVHSGCEPCRNDFTQPAGDSQMISSVTGESVQENSSFKAPPTSERITYILVITFLALIIFICIMVIILLTWNRLLRTEDKETIANGKEDLHHNCIYQSYDEEGTQDASAAMKEEEYASVDY